MTFKELINSISISGNFSIPENIRPLTFPIRLYNKDEISIIKYKDWDFSVYLLDQYNENNIQLSSNDSKSVYTTYCRLVQEICDKFHYIIEVSRISSKEKDCIDTVFFLVDAKITNAAFISSLNNYDIILCDVLKSLVNHEDEVKTNEHHIKDSNVPNLSASSLMISNPTLGLAALNNPVFFSTVLAQTQKLGSKVVGLVDRITEKPIIERNAPQITSHLAKYNTHLDRKFVNLLSYNSFLFSPIECNSEFDNIVEQAFDEAFTFDHELANFVTFFFRRNMSSYLYEEPKKVGYFNYLDMKEFLVNEEKIYESDVIKDVIINRIHRHYRSLAFEDKFIEDMLKEEIFLPSDCEVVETTEYISHDEDYNDDPYFLNYYIIKWPNGEEDWTCMLPKEIKYREIFESGNSESINYLSILNKAYKNGLMYKYSEGAYFETPKLNYFIMRYSQDLQERIKLKICTDCKEKIMNIYLQFVEMANHRKYKEGSKSEKDSDRSSSYLKNMFIHDIVRSAIGF